jgi:hypothetical protein
MVMDISGMVAELRLELDRIERSILILETLACPTPTRRALPMKRSNGSAERFAVRPSSGFPGRTGKVVSIERSTVRPQSEGGPATRAAVKDLFLSLRELRDQTVRSQQAISTLIRKPGD